MRLRLPIAALAFSILTLGCQKDAPTKLPDASPLADGTPEVVEPVAVKSVFDANCEMEGGILTDSPLQSKLTKLSESKYKYELVDYGQVDLKQSTFFGLKREAEYNPHALNFEVIGFENLMTQMAQAEFGKLKGTVDLGGRLFARATVEEYLFLTEDCAKVAEAYLIWAEESVPLNGPGYKTPRLLIRNKQAVYNVISGGAYMMDSLDEFETILSP